MALYQGSNNSQIEAKVIEVGQDFTMGDNVHIKVHGKFHIGDYGRFGNDVIINAEEVEIGDHFFHYEPGLNVGGGGSHYPEAIWKVGDRCVVHNNKINICRGVTMGNDVGLSPDVDIITHGFWQSALEGYPTKYAPVNIGNGVIVGQRSMILMGVDIADNIVIGASSVVVKSLLKAGGVYAGSPAKLMKYVKKPTPEEKEKIMDDIWKRYEFLVTRLPFYPSFMEYVYPVIRINNATINVLYQEITGEENIHTDNLRDFLRRYGIRIYTDRPFGRL